MARPRWRHPSHRHTHTRVLRNRLFQRCSELFFFCLFSTESRWYHIFGAMAEDFAWFHWVVFFVRRLGLIAMVTIVKCDCVCRWNLCFMANGESIWRGAWKTNGVGSFKGQDAVAKAIADEFLSADSAVVGSNCDARGFLVRPGRSLVGRWRPLASLWASPIGRHKDKRRPESGEPAGRSPELHQWRAAVSGADSAQPSADWLSSPTSINNTVKRGPDGTH